jgi:hypothetical protein
MSTRAATATASSRFGVYSVTRLTRRPPMLNRVPPVARTTRITIRSPAIAPSTTWTAPRVALHVHGAYWTFAARVHKNHAAMRAQ